MASNIISRTGIALLHNKLGAAVFIMFEHWCLICRLPTTTASLFLTVVVSYRSFFFLLKNYLLISCKLVSLLATQTFNSTRNPTHSSTVLVMMKTYLKRPNNFVLFAPCLFLSPDLLPWKPSSLDEAADFW